MGIRNKLRRWLFSDTDEAVAVLDKYSDTPANNELFTLAKQAIEVKYERAKIRMTSDARYIDGFRSIEFSVPRRVFSKKQYEELDSMCRQHDRELAVMRAQIHFTKVITGIDDHEEDEKYNAVQPKTLLTQKSLQSAAQTILGNSIYPSY